MEKGITIDAKIGRVIRRCYEDIVILKGDYPYTDSKFTENCKIVIKNDEQTKKYPIDINGYNLRLFIGNFSRRHTEDILVSGDTGGSGGYKIGILYQYNDVYLRQIFNGDNFFNKSSYKAKYLECYKVKITCGNCEKQYILDISDKSKEALKNIYDTNGKLLLVRIQQYLI